MFAGLTQFTPRMRVLSDSQIKEIHLAACEILERTGSLIHHKEAQDLLHSHGAVVEKDGLVRIPFNLVDRALAMHEAAPELRIVLDPNERFHNLQNALEIAGQLEDLDIVLEDKNPFFLPGGVHHGPFGFKGHQRFQIVPHDPGQGKVGGGGAEVGQEHGCFPLALKHD